MSGSRARNHDVEHEELLEGQTVFKGPHKIRQLFSNGEDSDAANR